VLASRLQHGLDDMRSNRLAGRVSGLAEVSAISSEGAPRWSKRSLAKRPILPLASRRWPSRAPL
jgi:hypothetical protein